MDATVFFAQSTKLYPRVLKTPPILIIKKTCPSLLKKIYSFYPSERIVEYPFIHENLPAKKGGTVLDVGSGASLLPFEIASKGYETWSIDLKRSYLKEIEYPHLTFVEGDIRSTSFQDNYFDAVTAVSVIEHIGFSDHPPQYQGDYAAIAEIRRILRPEGKLFFTVPFGVEGYYPSKEAPSWRVYSYDRLIDVLNGFVDVDIQYAILDVGGWRFASLSEASKINVLQRRKKWIVAGAVALIKAANARTLY